MEGKDEMTKASSSLQDLRRVGAIPNGTWLVPWKREHLGVDRCRMSGGKTLHQFVGLALGALAGPALTARAVATGVRPIP